MPNTTVVVDLERQVEALERALLTVFHAALKGETAFVQACEVIAKRCNTCVCQWVSDTDTVFIFNLAGLHACVQAHLAIDFVRFRQSVFKTLINQRLREYSACLGLYDNQCHIEKSVYCLRRM